MSDFLLGKSKRNAERLMQTRNAQRRRFAPNAGNQQTHLPHSAFSFCFERLPFKMQYQHHKKSSNNYPI